jgi:hypothetical protein
MECSGRLTFDAILLLIIFAFFTFSFGLIIFLIILVLNIFLIFVVFYVPMRVWSAQGVQHQFHKSCHLRMTEHRETRRKMAVNIGQQQLENGLAPRCAEMLAHTSHVWPLSRNVADRGDAIKPVLRQVESDLLLLLLLVTWKRHQLFLLFLLSLTSGHGECRLQQRQLERLSLFGGVRGLV